MNAKTFKVGTEHRTSQSLTLLTRNDINDWLSDKIKPGDTIEVVIRPELPPEPSVGSVVRVNNDSSTTSIVYSTTSIVYVRFDDGRLGWRGIGLTGAYSWYEILMAFRSEGPRPYNLLWDGADDE